MSVYPSDTPRCNACEQNILQYGPMTEPAQECLGLARELERDLAALQKDFDMQAEWLREWKRVAERLQEAKKS